MSLVKIIQPNIANFSGTEIEAAITFLGSELESRKTPTGLVCSECGSAVHDTPSGMVCVLGHGGAETTSVVKLTNDQKVAWAKIQAWTKTDAPIFLLKGFAGTGKSFLMKMLLELPYNFVFSAPTNKASSVLSDFIGLSVKTTYSVLGLRMTAEEDQQVLVQSNEIPKIGNNPILVIDEAGMVPKFMVKMLRRACAERGWRVIFVGDPAQHTPVGEDRSPCWSTVKDPAHKAMLKEVRRFDKQLLKLSIHLRDCVKDPTLDIAIVDDNDGKEGVFVMTERDWLKEVKSLPLEDWTTSKIVAWRNRTCDEYNRVVRKALGFKQEYVVGEVVLLTSPLFRDDMMVGHTDDELRILNIEERVFSFPECELPSYVFTVDKPYLIYAPKDPVQLNDLLNKRAARASLAEGRKRSAMWALFWDIRKQFTPVRYGYALTSHRLQGTTVKNVYAVQQDLMANRDRRARARGMYVTGTRPSLAFKTF